MIDGDEGDGGDGDAPGEGQLKDRSATKSTGNDLRIDFLYLEGCVSAGAALERLTQVIQEEEVAVRLNARCVGTPEEVESLGFPGSPTIRVEGVDIEQASIAAVGLSCRAYRDESGNVSGVPSKKRITSAIRRAKETREEGFY